MEKCFLIQIGDTLNDPSQNDIIMKAQLELCEESGDIVLASTVPASLSDREHIDEGGVHFTQEALNLIGEDAGRTAGQYVALETSSKAEKETE